MNQLTAAQLQALEESARNYGLNVAETPEQWTGYCHGLLHAVQVLTSTPAELTAPVPSDNLSELFDYWYSLIPDDYPFTEGTIAAAFDNRRIVSVTAVEVTRCTRCGGSGDWLNDAGEYLDKAGNLLEDQDDDPDDLAGPCPHCGGTGTEPAATIS
jgi:hypothetical protein